MPAFVYAKRVQRRQRGKVAERSKVSRSMPIWKNLIAQGVQDGDRRTGHAGRAFSSLLGVCELHIAERKTCG